MIALAFPTSAPSPPAPQSSSPAPPPSARGPLPAELGPQPSCPAPQPSAPTLQPSASNLLPSDTEALGDEIARLAAHLHAATYRLLVLLQAFDQREGWGGGFRSCAQWFSWRAGIGPGPAREKVRVARALPDLPLLSGAMARGELSYSKVRALTRVATPDNEGELLELARHATAAHVERLVRAWRRVERVASPEAEAERHRSRFLRLHPDEDGSWVIRGRLDPEVGAVLQKALAWGREALYRRDPAAGAGVEVSVGGSTGTAPGEGDIAIAEGSTAEQQRADALGLVAERALAGLETEAESTSEGLPTATGAESTSEGIAAEADSGRRPMPVGRADRFQVVVHVEVPPRQGPEEEREREETFPRKRLEEEERPGTSPRRGGLARAGRVDEEIFSGETARRLACDAGRVVMTHDTDGNVLDVGRRRRTVPPALRRALDHRDGECRFPGCGCRYTDAHHIRHWSEGGETKLENLVLLCRRHHRAVHEEGCRVEVVKGDVAGGKRGEAGEGEPAAGEGGKWRVHFFRPDGSPIPEVPPVPELPPDPVEALVRGHRKDGIDPDPWTPTPDWHGEPLDYGLALDMFWGLRGPDRG